MTAGTASPRNSRGPFGWLRTLIEFGVCLIIAVTAFRVFLAQGYMIETGSMGPGLRGYNRRAVCPSCRYAFCVGESHATESATCPNCGLRGLDVAQSVRHDGDQLLVCRPVFEWQDPHRYGVAVFRNPSDPKQAFVKRLVGLPGETVRILRGDLFINGRIQPKPLEIQRAQQVVVHDFEYQPNDRDADWQPRFLPEYTGNGWEAHGTEFGLDDALSADGERPDVRRSKDSPLPQVRYRHWIRHGGRHKTWVSLAAWPAGVPEPAGFDNLRFDALAQRLVCEGALSASRRDDLLSGNPAPEFAAAIHKLYEGSHIAPITDECGYNGGRIEPDAREVRDFCLSLTLAITEGTGLFVMGVSDGTESYEFRLDTSRQEIDLVRLKTNTVVRNARLQRRWDKAAVELFLMDRRARVTINGEELFAPFDYPAPQQPGPTPWKPVWFGGQGLKAVVSSLKLYRDVHYTPAGERAVSGPAVLGPDEYFALGDNSPVSHDSRMWAASTPLTRNLIIGKPFVVHLPSVRRRIQVGTWSTDIRIPEFSRIRYIR